MAKVGAPLLPADVPPGAAALVQRAGTKAGDAARYGPHVPTASSLTIADWAALHADIKAAWLSMRPWMRFRWTICAWRQGVHDNPAAPTVGGGGYALFVRCWLDQRPKNLPISPCARRTWDPAASAWDYTP